MQHRRELKAYSHLIIAAIETSNTTLRTLILNNIHIELKKHTTQELPDFQKLDDLVELASKNNISQKTEHKNWEHMVYPWLEDQKTSPYEHFILPKEFNKEKFIKKINWRLKKCRYITPPEFRERIQKVLKNTVAYNNDISDNLIWFVHDFLYNHTSINTTNALKRNTTDSKLMLTTIEYLLHKEINQAP